MVNRTIHDCLYAAIDFEKCAWVMYKQPALQSVVSYTAQSTKTLVLCVHLVGNNYMHLDSVVPDPAIDVASIFHATFFVCACIYAIYI